MMDLTFAEQVKIILSRRGMTIKELAELIEKHTGKKMSRQNLTQRLGRDNFQEQDMRMIAGILGCPFYLNILDENVSVEAEEPHREDKGNYIEEVQEPVEAVYEEPAIEEYAGELYSEEHGRKFTTEKAGFQVLKDPTDGTRLVLAIDRKPIAEWFKEQFEKLRQNIRQPIQQQRKSRGMKL